jgi:poly-gamma-glutamate capsule biosynthesis protein CapA/YwtB (metallophosphatase superfamily)
MRVTVMALGDVNLGRSVGQVLLTGDIAYPFGEMQQVLVVYDVVFANLESQIANLGGETQHPSDRYRFCAPPQAAQALRLGGISVVSTSNNHAFDYGREALAQTIDNLAAEGVLWTGTSKDSVELFPPAVVERNGIRLGFLAYTEFVNRGKEWSGRISVFEGKRMQREISDLRQVADLVIASYHGGVEYADAPSKYTLGQMRMLADAGADVVFGHHPHVPQGIELYKNTWIFYSLGNCLFLQQQREWTQKSFGASLTVRKSGDQTKVENVALVPLLVSNRPTFSVSEEVVESILTRLQRLSSVRITRKGTELVVSRFDH